MAGEAGRFITHLATPLAKEIRNLYEYTNPDKFTEQSDEELARHIEGIRNQAYKIAPWPCIGSFRFLNPGCAHAGPSNTYSNIVNYLKANRVAKVLDLGCCFGHDARQLLKDGVQPTQIVACDLLPELLNLGFEMFGDQKDQGHLRGLTWEKVDIFKQQDIEKIKQPNGYYAIYIGSFIHLFPLEYQKKVVTALDELLSKEKGSKIWGRQTGTQQGQAGPRQRIVQGSRGPVGIPENEDGARESAYAHDVDTLKGLFEEQGSGSWEAVVMHYDLKSEKGGELMWKGGGEVMIDAASAEATKRLTFAVTRK